ncbi:MAG: DNA-protecting protein DprA, partial [Caulobacteraceae bacterium]|nr:DNA-protecting protein DprA [Caulobacteraceae bacterium]
MSPGPLSPAERRDWLRLARAETVGPVTFSHLIRRYGAAAAAIEAIPELARRGGRAEALRVPSLAAAEAELEAGERLGARLIAACEPDFPPLVSGVVRPPRLIWLRCKSLIASSR